MNMRNRWARGAIRSLLACIVSGVALVLVGEVLLYDAYSFMWKWPRGSSVQPSLKVLFLSDPHIQCSFSAYEPWLFRWDADRYLRQAYSRAIRQMNPDAVVILGDLFAEGFKASSVEWADYLKCKDELLHMSEDILLIVVPGDNDIGGEGMDGMSEEVNRRYIAEFGPLNALIVLRNIAFVKVNTPSFINPAPQGVVEANARLEAELFLRDAARNLTGRPLTPGPVVVLSHVPLAHLATPAGARELIVDTVQPSYLFSGHTHRPMVHCHHSDKGGCTLQEITLPTSSYRMGEAHAGLGAAVIGENGHLGYEVLWFPPRFPVLFCYLLWTIATAVTVVTCVCCRCVLCRTTAN